MAARMTPSRGESTSRFRLRRPLTIELEVNFGFATSAGFGSRSWCLDRSKGTAISSQYSSQLLLLKSSLLPTAPASDIRTPQPTLSSELSQVAEQVLDLPTSSPFGSPARALGNLFEPPG
ncbi:hypothetical protein UPYG_G00241320 [Umbra pygmaea]|uniref:Uncharacterized protein n=1 Tax=Umbra pygmaea TaxID=75934 RepID=A0ABD0WXM6_UMBPY